MRKEEIDPILKELESSRDRTEMRRLLHEADACRTCPEQDLLDKGLEECSCLLRFRAELKNRLTNILTKRGNPPRRDPSK